MSARLELFTEPPVKIAKCSFPLNLEFWENFSSHSFHLILLPLVICQLFIETFFNCTAAAARWKRKCEWNNSSIFHENLTGCSSLSFQVWSERALSATTTVFDTYEIDSRPELKARKMLRRIWLGMRREIFSSCEQLEKNFFLLAECHAGVRERWDERKSINSLKISPRRWWVFFVFALTVRRTLVNELQL